jgi:hypothetical protein
MLNKMRLSNQKSKIYRVLRFFDGLMVMDPLLIIDICRQNEEKIEFIRDLTRLIEYFDMEEINKNHQMKQFLGC